MKKDEFLEKISKSLPLKSECGYGLSASEYDEILDFIKETIDEKYKYKKALNKACEQLSCMDWKIGMLENPNSYDCDYLSEDEWKEWCLSDE